MATIQSTIQLYDSFSPVMRNVLDSVDLTIAGVEQMQRELGEDFNTNALREARESILQAGAAMVSVNERIIETENHINNNTSGQNRFNSSLQNGNNIAGNLVNTIKRIAGAYLTVQGVQKALDISDQLTQTTARLKMMNNAFAESGMEQQELMNTIYSSAQNARASYGDMADVVARFGNNARDAFGSTAEVVDFANLIQKQMKIAGATTQESSAAMLQLSQALGSGVLRGDELNSIFEQAPNLIQNIADYMDVPIGQIREMAKEGEITADIVKASVFAATDEINQKFGEIPMTWGDIGTYIANGAQKAFQPFLQKINDIANSDTFQTFTNGAIEGMAALANVVLNVFEVIANVGGFIADNWSIISPIIYGVVAALILYAGYLAVVKAAELIGTGIKIAMCIATYAHAAATGTAVAATTAETAAQYGLNTALLSCPITWIILLIIALIAIFYAVIAAINEFAETSYSATGIICGIFAVAGAFIGNLFIALINSVMDVFAVLWNFIAAFVNFFANVFNDPVGAIARLFFDLVDCILGLLETLASAIDTIFGSNLAGAVSGWRDSLGSWVDSKFGKGEEIMAKVNATDYHLDRFEYSGAWDAGYSFGQGIEDKVSNLSLSNLLGATDIPSSDYTNAGAGAYGDTMANIADNTGATAGNTKDIKDALDITDEDLKYLRDIAEREVIDRTVLKSVTIDMSGMTNKVENMQDLDGIGTYIANSLKQQMAVSMEGA